jgi:hypothetical protein
MKKILRADIVGQQGINLIENPMNLTHLEEPELEFGSGRHVDVRFGIMNLGPLDFGSSLAPREIPIGIVGTLETIEGVRRLAGEVPDRHSRQEEQTAASFSTLSSFSVDTGFHCSVVIEDTLCGEIPKSRFLDLGKIADLEERIRHAVEIFLQEIRYLTQTFSALL